MLMCFFYFIFFFQGKQAYAERQLERLKTKKSKMVENEKKSEGVVSNGILTNGHVNGYANGVTKRKA